MTYRELFYKATRLINNNKITLGEYEEMTKPLDREVEQEPILDKIRAEIDKIYKREGNSVDCLNALDELKEFIDKYKGESEGT